MTRTIGRDGDNLRQNVYLTQEAVGTAKKLARARGVSLSFVVRDALALYEAADIARREGATVGAAKDHRLLDFVLLAPA